MVQKIRQLSAILTFFIMGYVPFHALISTWLISNFGNKILFKSLKDILVFGVFSVLVGALLIYRTKILLNRRLLIAVSLYFAINIAYLLFSDGSVSQKLAGFDVNLRFLCFFIIAYIVGANSSNVERKVIKLALISVAIVCLFAVLQSTLLPENFLRHFGYGEHTIPPYLSIDGAGGMLRYSSTLRGPNVLGSYLLITIPLQIVYWTRIRKTLPRYYRLLTLAVISASLLALYFTYSRSAWLGLAVALLAIAMLNVKKYRRLMIIGIALAIVAGFGIVLPNRNNYLVQQLIFHSDPGEVDKQDSDVERIRSIKSGLSKAKDGVIGHGIGSSGTPSTYGDNPVIIENYFLDIAYQFGYLGLGILLAIYYYTFRLLWIIRKNWLAASLIGVLIGLTVSGMFWPVWSDETVAYTWWGLTGILLGKFSKKPLKL